MSDNPSITVRFPITLTDASVRCPLCGHFLMPSLITLHGGHWYQIHYYVTGLDLVMPTFCSGHNKYDPVFLHAGETKQETPIPAVFREAFEEDGADEQEAH